MTTYGLKVSLPTKDISSAEPRDFIFNSEYATVKIYSQGSGNVTVNAGSTADVSVTHSLNFVPMCMVFSKINGHWYNGCFILKVSDFNGIYFENSSTYTYADATYLKFRYYNDSGSNVAVYYYYYIFGDVGL